jgi:cardiolipin synthase A/B
MRAYSILLLSALIGCSGARGDDPAALPPVSDGAPIQAPTPEPDRARNDAGATDAATDARPPNTACNPTDPRATPVAVAVLPDESEKPFVDFLSAAQTTIAVFGYEMGYGGVLDTLQAKAKAGVAVRVILDGNTQRATNDKYRALLEAAGAKFEWSDPKFSYMHAKTLIVDLDRAIVSTSNYSLSYILKERNYVATLTDPQDVADLAALFDADWTQSSPDLSCSRLIVSPVNSEGRLADLVKSAEKTIVIESMQFADKAVHDAVLARKAAGVDVRVLLAAPSWISANTQAGADLTTNAVPARWLASPAVHVKSIVVDGKYAYLGSENISYTSLTKNREIGIVLSDAPALSAMLATFEKDWAAATAF